MQTPEAGKTKRIDELGRENYRIIQDRTKFCFGIDATFLAWYAEIEKGDEVLDLCSGNGIVMLLTDARNVGKANYTGLEINESSVALAKESIELNQISDHMKAICGNVKSAAEIFGKAKFDVITVNPPYMPAGKGLTNPDWEKAIARHEIECTLADVISESAKLLKPGGRFYMVHRPQRLSEIFESAKENGLSVEKIKFIYPTKKEEAILVLIKATRGGRKMLHVESPLIIYKGEAPHTNERDGSEEYTDEVKRIYNE